MSDTQRALPRPGQLGMWWEMQLMPLVQNLPGRVTKHNAQHTHSNPRSRSTVKPDCHDIT